MEIKWLFFRKNRKYLTKLDIQQTEINTIDNPYSVFSFCVWVHVCVCFWLIFFAGLNKKYMNSTNT